jgi:hypothetical protein
VVSHDDEERDQDRPGPNLVFLTRALKAPTPREAIPRLIDRAQAEFPSHEEFLVAWPRDDTWVGGLTA